MGGEDGQHLKGVRRSARLFALHRIETTEPKGFYEFLAEDTCRQLESVGAQLSGVSLDIGGGPGYVSRALEARGMRCIVAEPGLEEMHLHGNSPSKMAVLGDGQRLPFPDATLDLVHCSNVLEHVPEPFVLLDELVRVLKADGIGYMSFTPWWSPWGGHETSPWHYLGGERAAQRYERRHGVPPKNRFGAGLYELHIPEVRRWFESNDKVETMFVGPRFWPPSWRMLARVPAVGEVLTWNLLVMFRRRYQ